MSKDCWTHGCLKAADYADEIARLRADLAAAQAKVQEVSAELLKLKQSKRWDF